MKKTLIAFLSIVGMSVMAQRPVYEFKVAAPRDNSPIIITGADPSQVTYTEPVIYNEPVQYNQPVQYTAPVVYNATLQYFAPVQYGPNYTTVVNNEPPYALPDYWDVDPLECGPDNCVETCSSVQVIYFGEGQAAQQGYSFNAPR